MGIGNLGERRLKRLHEGVRELAYKANRVGDSGRLAARQHKNPRRGVKCGEELVLHVHTGVGQAVKQRRLAGVGVACQGNAEDIGGRALFALHIAVGGNVGKLATQHGDAVANETTVDLKLAFALAKARANAAARPVLGKVRPHAAQAWIKVLQLGHLHLQLALMGLGMQAKDVEDERCAVDDLVLHSQDALDVCLLRRRQLGIEDDDVGIAALCEVAQFKHLA